MAQLKKVSTSIDEESRLTTEQLAVLEKTRNEALREIGNLLHPSVVVSDNEVNQQPIFSCQFQLLTFCF